MEFSLKGVDKDLFVEGTKIKIHKRKGFLQAETDKTIPIGKVSSIQLKKPGLAAGYIQFSVIGDHSISNMVSGSTMQAATDENAVLFMGNEAYEVALKIKEYLEAFEEGKSPGAIPGGSVSAADELRKFKALFDEGVISQEDFEAKKKQLLSTGPVPQPGISLPVETPKGPAGNDQASVPKPIQVNPEDSRNGCMVFIMIALIIVSFFIGPFALITIPAVLVLWIILMRKWLKRRADRKKTAQAENTPPPAPEPQGEGPENTP
jgi:hypothetical protein